MKASINTILIALGVSTAAAQYTNQSAPFNLILLSQNSTLNGSALSACHEGAAIEGLCLSGPPLKNATYQQFQFNSSAQPFSGIDPKIGEPGYLTFELRGGNFNLSSPMGLTYNPASNVAVPEFTPSESSLTLVAFDECSKMNIQGYVDDRTNPPTLNKVTAYYRWYVCRTYVGYLYTTLAWVMGDHSPQNPSCVKVDVVRVFV
jgi:hypothetical protein